MSVCSKANACGHSVERKAQLASSRARLRPVQESDSDDFYTWINDRSTVVFNASFRPISRAEHDRWFKALSERRDLLVLGVEDAESGQLIGSCQLFDINVVHRSAELQIRIGEASARGRGLGTAALGQLLQIGFEDMNLHRIWLRVFSDNRRAIRVYEKLGFISEGIQREAAFIAGRYTDVLIMGMLRRDYSPIRAQ